MNKELLGVVGLLSATILWGAGFLAVDLALTAFTPMQIMAVRFFLASIIMFFAARKSLQSVLKQEVIAGIIMGLCLFLAFTLQTIGLKFSKKCPALREFAGMILAMAGAGFLTLTKDFTIGIGDTLSLAGAFFFACQVFFTGKYAPHYRTDILSFVQITTAFVLSCISLPFTGGMAEIVWGKNALLSILYLGIVSTAITYFLQTSSQRYVKQVQAVIILSLEAVFATLFSVLLIHEKLSFRVLCGALLILSAVFIS